MMVYEKQWRAGSNSARMVAVMAATMSLGQEAAAQGESLSASDESSTETAITEIVVTAQRRSERLMDVPLTISVMSGSDAATAGAKGFETLQGRVPGMQIFGIDPMSMQFSMRGVITDRAARTAQTAALYLDDVPIGLGSANPNFQQLDVERIEVLRGPQGTLYGAGAQSGALRIITNKPQLRNAGFGGGAEVSSTDGGDLNTLVYGVANVPFGEAAAVRALGYTRGDGGFVDNVALGKERTNRGRVDGGRVSMLVEPKEDLSIGVMLAYQELTADDSGLTDRALPEYQQGTTVLQELAADNFVAALTVDYQLDFGTLTYVASFQDTDSFRLIDATRYAIILGAPAGLFPQAAFPTSYLQEGYSQELRITSSDEGRLRWIAGAFYSDVDSSITQSFITPGFEAAVPTASPAASFGLQQDNLYQGTQSFATEQRALFVDGTLDILDRLALSAGVRWYSFEQEGLVDYNGLLQGRRDALSGRTEEDGFNPRINLSYSLTPDALMYVQAARGFRIGGINEPVPDVVCGADLAAIGLSAPPVAYDSDKLWSYELGIKATLASKRLQVGLAVFDIDWEDVQVTKRLGCGYAVILNGGKLSSRGMEFEATLKALDHLTLTANVSYTNSEIAETSSTIGLGTETGQKAPYQPDWTYYFAADYRRPFAGEWNGFATVEFSRTGDRRTEFNPAIGYHMPHFETIGLRIGLERNDWQGFLFAENLTNEYGVLDNTRRGGSFPVYVSSTTIRPRTVGLRIVKSF